MVEGPDLNSVEMIHQIKINTCNFDIAKRWYVEYYILDQASNLRTRKRDYGFCNREKNPNKRLELLNELKQKIVSGLEHEREKNTRFITSDSSSITWFLKQYIIDKSKVLEPKTIKSYKYYLENFHSFLIEKKMAQSQPHLITKQTIYEFRDSLTHKLTNRGVNNHLDCVKGFFSYVIKKYDDVLFKNPCTGIIKFASKSENHVAYTSDQAMKISKHLLTVDKQLLQYCRVVAYGFLRCKEARNLKISDIDFERRTITLPASNVKSKKRTVKPMLDTLYKYLMEMELHKYPPSSYLFTIKRVPGIKKTNDCYFQKRFQKVKQKFGLTDKHTIYSFRHTFVCELLDSGANWHEIMKYTGHTTFAAFEKYARSILNKPATDLSKNIKIKF